MSRHHEGRRKVPSEKDYRPANGDSPASKGTRILCEEKLQVSEKFTTEELVAALDSYKIKMLPFLADRFVDAIVARLRAADALCAAAVPIAGEISSFDDNDRTEYQVIRFKDLVRLRKVIADYREET